MNRDEILLKSQQENKDEDEREKNIRAKAGIPFIIAFCIACSVFMMFDLFFLESDVLHRCFITTLLFCGAAEFWYLAISIRRSVWWYIAASAITVNFIFNIIPLIMKFKEIL